MKNIMAFRRRERRTRFPILSSILLGSALIITLLSACTNSTHSTRSDMTPLEKAGYTPDDRDPQLDMLKPTFEINPNGRGGYYLAFTAGGGGKTGSPSLKALHSMQSVTFKIYGPDDALLDSLYTETITTSGTMNSETNETALTASAGLEWTPSDPPEEDTYGVMVLQSLHGFLALEAAFPTKKTAPGSSVHIELEAEPSGTGIRFTLRAERLADPPEGEYLPSGEQFRIEIRDDLGETIWSSSGGMMFTQAVQPVQPNEKGQKITHTAYWDGQSDLTRNFLKPGIYPLIATIPAKPNPYILREELSWSGR